MRSSLNNCFVVRYLYVLAHAQLQGLICARRIHSYLNYSISHVHCEVTSRIVRYLVKYTYVLAHAQLQGLICARRMHSYLKDCFLV